MCCWMVRVEKWPRRRRWKHQKGSQRSRDWRRRWMGPARMVCWMDMGKRRHRWVGNRKGNRRNGSPSWSRVRLEALTGPVKWDRWVEWLPPWSRPVPWMIMCCTFSVNGKDVKSKRKIKTFLVLISWKGHFSKHFLQIFLAHFSLFSSYSLSFLKLIFHLQSLFALCLELKFSLNFFGFSRWFSFLFESMASEISSIDSTFWEIPSVIFFFFRFIFLKNFFEKGFFLEKFFGNLFFENVFFWKCFFLQNIFFWKSLWVVMVSFLFLGSLGRTQALCSSTTFTNTFPPPLKGHADGPIATGLSVRPCLWSPTSTRRTVLLTNFCDKPSDARNCGATSRRAFRHPFPLPLPWRTRNTPLCTPSRRDMAVLWPRTSR